MKFNTRLFLILWSAGFVGALSLVLIDLEALIKILPMPPETEIPPGIRFVTPIQPAVILAVAVWVGVSLAAKLGLSAPVAEAIASRGDWVSALKPQIIPGIVGGFAGGTALVLIASILKPFLTPETLTRLGSYGNILPIPTRLLYGGIFEELLLRWGFMTLLVWAAFRLFQKKRDKPTTTVFVAAILISSLIFAIDHLPVAYMLFPNLTFPLLLFAIIGNSAFGLIGGYLYWRKGLESAIIAHALTHVVMITASHFGAYF